MFLAVTLSAYVDLWPDGELSFVTATARAIMESMSTAASSGNGLRSASNSRRAVDRLLNRDLIDPVTTGSFLISDRVFPDLGRAKTSTVAIGCCVSGHVGGS